MVFEILFAAAVVSAAIDPVRQDVVCAEVGFSRSVENRDFQAFIDYLDPEARFVTGQVSRGPEEIGQAWAGFFARDGALILWRPAIVEVVANGTLAISRGSYRVTTIGDTGEPAHVWGTFNSTWRLSANGEWKVLFDAGGDHGKTPTAEEIEVLNAEPECPGFPTQLNRGTNDLPIQTAQ
jgi:ketosteroid isomerase-like protein